jgi:HSP20 family protein
MRSGDPSSWMWAEACAMIERAERVQRALFNPCRSDASPVNWEPPIDVFETEGELWILVALPGVEAPDPEVSIEAGMLRVSGARRLPAVARVAAVHRLEIPRGRFERRIPLPAVPFELTHSQLFAGCLQLILTKRREPG